MSLRFFTNTKVGELMSRLNNDVVGAQNAISNTITSIVTNVIQTVAILAVMFTLEWRLTLMSLVILPLFVADRPPAGGAASRHVARRGMDLNAQMNAHMNETLNIGGALLVKLFGRTVEEEQRFRERAAGVRDIGVRRAVLGSSLFAVLGIIGAVGMALIYGIGGYYVILGSFSIGTIVAFGSYLGTLYGALQGLAGAPVDFSTSMVSFERVFEVIDLPQDIVEKANAFPLADVRGELEFDRVTFKYTIEDDKLLSQVKRYWRMDEVTAVLSLTGKPEAGERQGEEVSRRGNQRCISGPRGGPGDCVVCSPARTVGRPGRPLLGQARPRSPISSRASTIQSKGSFASTAMICATSRSNSLSAAIGMVTQETYLFHDSIRTNLTYARVDATQTEIEAAARAANIHNFIVDLPERYDTIVGERGYRLSGGEKQRIALARVILKDPRILILDEATSSLDSKSEALIQDALKRVMAGRTSIVIAHRLSTILAADLILVMDRGQIVERGTHSELLALGGSLQPTVRNAVQKSQRTHLALGQLSLRQCLFVE